MRSGKNNDIKIKTIEIYKNLNCVIIKTDKEVSYTFKVIPRDSLNAQPNYDWSNSVKQEIGPSSKESKDDAKKILEYIYREKLYTKDEKTLRAESLIPSNLAHQDFKLYMGTLHEYAKQISHSSTSSGNDIKETDPNNTGNFMPPAAVSQTPPPNSGAAAAQATSNSSSHAQNHERKTKEMFRQVKFLINTASASNEDDNEEADTSNYVERINPPGQTQYSINLTLSKRAEGEDDWQDSNDTITITIDEIILDGIRKGHQHGDPSKLITIERSVNGQRARTLQGNISQYPDPTTILTTLLNDEKLLKEFDPDHQTYIINALRSKIGLPEIKMPQLTQKEISFNGNKYSAKLTLAGPLTLEKPSYHLEISLPVPSYIMSSSTQEIDAFKAALFAKSALAGIDPTTIKTISKPAMPGAINNKNKQLFIIPNLTADQVQTFNMALQEVSLDSAVKETTDTPPQDLSEQLQQEHLRAESQNQNIVYRAPKMEHCPINGTVILSDDTKLNLSPAGQEAPYMRVTHGSVNLGIYRLQSEYGKSPHLIICENADKTKEYFLFPLDKDMNDLKLTINHMTGSVTNQEPIANKGQEVENYRGILPDLVIELFKQSLFISRLSTFANTQSPGQSDQLGDLEVAQQPQSIASHSLSYMLAWRGNQYQNTATQVEKLEGGAIKIYGMSCAPNSQPQWIILYPGNPAKVGLPCPGKGNENNLIVKDANQVVFNQNDHSNTTYTLYLESDLILNQLNQREFTLPTGHQEIIDAKRQRDPAAKYQKPNSSSLFGATDHIQNPEDPGNARGGPAPGRGPNDDD